MRKIKRLLPVLLAFSLAEAWAGNVTQSVTRVTSAVTLSSEVDYHITGTTPFSGSGSVNITNTDHAVLIIDNIKPTKVVASWLSYVKINGAAAVDGTNCQVKMFNNGAIIFPYSSSMKPLTCYTGRDFTGTSSSDYSVGHDGNGYMKTLTSATLNNQIRSFKLKRGYMVTFALGTGGWGYSRCFIADMEDLEINMPTNMDARVSSYRLFKWNNAKKAGLASNTSTSVTDVLNVSWCYDWGVGWNLGDYGKDTECVPNHIYEGWPAISDCGKVDYSCHLKANNEPGNSSDDHPQSVDEVLSNWQEMMRTGLRLCSESSHDGSMNHLKAFIDSVDARGWRCDILDLHCYWPAGTFNSLTWYSDNYGNGRPIWISEWVWGASWNSNGFWAAVGDAGSTSAANQQALYDGTKPILDVINANTRVERYAYWNSEAAGTRIYNNGLTTLGNYYASMNSGLGYNAANEFVPRVVYHAPTNFSCSYNEVTGACSMSWDDSNGDMLDSLCIQVIMPGKTRFATLQKMTLVDQNSKNGASYSHQYTLPRSGTYKLRVAAYPMGNATPLTSRTITVVTPGEGTYEDVTSQYVTNWGFDVTSDRQTANLTNSATSYKTVTGWTTTSDNANGCAGCFGFGSSYTFNGTSVPATDIYGAATGGMIAASQGWSGTARYTQNVTLPAGDYRFSYRVYNVKNTASFTNLTGVVIDGANHYGALTSLTPGQWATEVVEFVLTEQKTVTLSVGYQGVQSTSTTNAFLCFDGVKIERQSASYNDVTSSYIQNWGFDVTGDYQTANLTNGSANHKAVTGWTTTNTNTWGCSGAFAIGSSYQINGTAIPATTASGTATGGVLAFSEGWSGQAVYTQDVTLPKGAYKLTYSMYNAKNDVAFTNLTGVVVDGEAHYGATNSLAAGSWKTEAVTFELYDATTVTFSVGFGAVNNTSTANPFLSFDYVTLETLDVQQEEDYPINMTDRLANPTCSSLTGWTLQRNAGNGTDWQYQNASYTNGNVSLNQFIERWANGATLSNSVAYQTITDLPNGIYTVEADFIAAWQGTGEDNQTGNYMFVRGAISDSLNVSTGNATPEHYELVAVVDDGTLTIGFETLNTTSNWIGMDNWQLYYYGMDEDLLREQLNKAIANTTTLLNQPMNAEAKNQLNTIVSAARDATETDDMVAMFSQLETALQPAAHSAEAYAALTNAIQESAATTTARPSSTGQDAYDNAIGALNSAISQGSLADDEIDEQVIYVKGLTNQYLMADVVSEGEPNTDVSFLLSNTDFEELAQNGWTTNPAGATNYNCFEVWNSNFTISQTLYGLPAGTYTLTSQAYYRSGNNEDLANTPLALNAKLFINDQTADIMSIVEGASAEENKSGNWVDYQNGSQIPNNMEAAAYAFGTLKAYQPGNGLNSVSLEVAEDGQTLVVGAKKETLIAGDWTIFNNFRLYYTGVPEQLLGDADGSGVVDVSDVVTYIGYTIGTGSNIVAANSDLNGDGAYDVDDIIILINWIINGHTEDNPDDPDDPNQGDKVILIQGDDEEGPGVADVKRRM